MWIADTVRSLLPSLFTAGSVLAVLWLALWLTTRAIQKMALRMEAKDGARKAEIEEWSKQLTQFLRHSVETAGVLAAGYILLRGAGVSAIPQLTWDQVTAWLLGPGMHILIVLLAAYIVVRGLSMLAHQLPILLVARHGSLREIIERTKRTDTIVRVLRRTITAIVVASAILISLRQMGMDVTPILAGAGILGLAVGFGAQHLVRDVISGVFMIVENQVRVGDVAVINGKSGLVEAIRLRTIVLRSVDGTVHVIPNGEITELANMTKDYSYYLLDLSVDYKADVDQVMTVMREVAEAMRKEPEFGQFILEPLEILGVHAFSESGVVIRARIKTVPIKQWVVGRELRRRLKKEFDAKGIELPNPHLAVYMGEKNNPLTPEEVEAELSRRSKKQTPDAA